ncbi:MAG: TonB-dependent receptor, partial [Paludibacteraceae bacterium]|nr:TonB-dependent receptor [Paludibacteraceae bacterium]
VTIQGRIIDAGTQQPIEFVTVSIYNPATSKNLAGALTNQDGVFNIASVANGTYELRISFVGYSPFNKEFNVNGSDVRFGNIPLTEDSKMLKEVQVVGQGSQMRFDIDKKVFSVDQNIAAAGGSATDVLQNIPSVDVDNDGNISLRNNASVEVWINGKPSGLTADNRAQVLQQMPAENIESIEVMTNPSAKFNPEGTAGIINLVMKKNRKAGYYGSLSAGATLQNGKPGSNAGASINYNVGKFDVFANLGYRRMVGNGWGLTERTNYNNGDSTLLNQNSKTEFKMGGVFFRAGVDYHLDSKNTIGINGFGHNGMPDMYSNTDYLLTRKATNAKLRDYSRENNASDQHKGYNVNLYHRIDFDKKGSNLMTNLSYSEHGNLGNQRYTQLDRLAAANNQDITQIADGNSNTIELKTDYTKKFTDNNRLELGWSSIWNDRLSNASGTDNFNNKDIPEYYNVFDYAEQIHAGYATYGTRIDNFSVQAGVRGEYFRKDITSTSSRESIKLDPQSYFKVYPSVYLSYSLPNNNEVQLNYTRRVDRPRGRMVNSFRDYSDSTNISYGNPLLMPEMTSAFELNYIKNWDNHTLSSSIYYRLNNDDIERVSFLRNGVMESTFMNLTKEHDMGVELVAKNRLFKILNLTSSLNFYYNKLDASVYTNELYPEVRVVLPAHENFSWDGRVIANLMLSPTFSGQVTGQYRSERLTPQGKQLDSYSMDLGLRKSFFEKKFSVNFNVRDLFDSRKFRSVTSGEGFYQYSENKRMGRMFGLTLTYNFGNTKPKPVDRPKPSESEESDEMDME